MRLGVVAVLLVFVATDSAVYCHSALSSDRTFANAALLEPDCTLRPQAEAILAFDGGVLFDTPGQVANELCPGATYVLQAAFGRNAVAGAITATSGVHLEAQSGLKCANKVVMSDATTVPNIHTKLVVPCMADGEIDLQVTALVHNGIHYAYRHTLHKYPVNPACAVPSCAKAASDASITPTDIRVARKALQTGGGTVTIKGWIYDNLCLYMANGIAVDGTNVKFGAANHTTGCMLIPACVASGYVIQQQNLTDGSFYPVYNITNSSAQTVVVPFLQGVPRKQNVYVEVTGAVTSTGALQVTNITDTVVTVSGWIYDKLCLYMANGIAVDGTNVKYGVANHTTACMLIPACVASGYVLQYQNHTDNSFYPAYQLSPNSTQLIVAFLQAFTRPDNVFVTVSGKIDNNGELAIFAIKDGNNVTAAGWIYDNLCLYMASGIAVDGTSVKYGVADHTTGCMLIPACVASGYVLQELNPADASYYPAYNFTNASAQAVIVPFLNRLQASGQAKDVYVIVTGTVGANGQLTVANVTNAPRSSAPPVQLAPPPPASKNGTCPPSVLGYQCSLALSGGFVAHWSVNASAPMNACTRGGGNTSAAGMLHMALSGPSAAMGLGFSPGKTMINSDIALGWTNGNSVDISTFIITAYGVDQSAALSSANSWATFKGISNSATDGSTTICLTRPLNTPLAGFSKNLVDVQSSVNMIFSGNFPGSGFPTSEHRLMDAFTINLVSGSATTGGLSTKTQIVIIHGALMMAAWVLLFPLGILMARHKWLLGEAKVVNVHIWFHLHRLINICGMVLFIVAFAYAWSYFVDPLAGGDVGNAHRGVGTAVMGLASLQVILGFVRPHPGTKLRPMWNLFHHNLGRLTLVTAWTAIYLGIWIAADSPTYQFSYQQWLVPAAVIMGCFVLVDVVLTVRRSFLPPAVYKDPGEELRDLDGATENQHQLGPISA